MTACKRHVPNWLSRLLRGTRASAGLGAAQLALAGSMEQFEFACIGASMTEDERVISHSLHHFARLMRTIEDERERMVSTHTLTLSFITSCLTGRELDASATGGGSVGVFPVHCAAGT